jgi:N6-adenosine-specific RNA methylase IME4
LSGREAPPEFNPEAKFGVIFADPPWAYRNFSSTLNGAAQAHYDLMSTRDMGPIRADRWAAENCVLAMWATWPKLDEALWLVRRWRFNYVSVIPWIKTVEGGIKRGIGFWSMGCSEPLLICTRGEPKRRRGAVTPLGLFTDGPEGQRIFYAPRGRHSEKPEEVQDWFEDLLTGPFLELFARRPRPGWTTWGRETGYVLGPDGVRWDPSGIKPQQGRLFERREPEPVEEEML